MAKLFGGLGIGPQSTVVLYGDPVQFGSYAFWAFTMAGHANLRLLDGGRRKWILEGRPLSRDVPHFPAVAYPTPSGSAPMRVSRDDVRAHLREPRRLLLDLRSPEEYSGERVSDYSFAVDHGAERTGRIPGAVHLYFKDLLNADDSFKSPEALRARARATPASRRKNTTTSSAIAGSATAPPSAGSRSAPSSASTTSRSTTARGPNGAASSASRSRSSQVQAAPAVLRR